MESKTNKQTKLKQKTSLDFFRQQQGWWVANTDWWIWLVIDQVSIGKETDQWTGPRCDFSIRSQMASRTPRSNRRSSSTGLHLHPLNQSDIIQIIFTDIAESAWYLPTANSSLSVDIIYHLVISVVAWKSPVCLDENLPVDLYIILTLIYDWMVDNNQHMNAEMSRMRMDLIINWICFGNVFHAVKDDLHIITSEKIAKSTIIGRRIKFLFLFPACTKLSHRFHKIKIFQLLCILKYIRFILVTNKNLLYILRLYTLYRRWFSLILQNENKYYTTVTYVRLHNNKQKQLLHYAISFTVLYFQPASNASR